MGALSRRTVWAAFLLGCVDRFGRAEVVWANDAQTIAGLNQMLAEEEAGRPCATINPAQSNGWADENGKKRFSINVHVEQWVPYTELILSWATPIEIESIYHAKLLKLRNRGHDLHVELEVTPSAGKSFIVMGSGSSSIHPQINCKALEGPPPSPPHAGDCDLGMTYEIKEAYADTATFDIHLRRWSTTRTITVAFWGQRIDVDGISNAEMTSSKYSIATGDSVSKFLLSAPPICVGDGVDTETGAAWKQDCDSFTPSFTFHASPIPRRPPHVICHDPWPPPPPPSMPSPPPPCPAPPTKPGPAPPPPPGPVVVAPASCMLGGVARLAAYLPRRGDHDVVRIVVEPDFWKVGYLVDVGLSGREVEVEHLSHVTLMPAVQMDADATTFSFSLQNGAAAFSFEAHGLDLALAALDCRAPPAGTETRTAPAPISSRASPPPRPKEKAPTLSSYDSAESYSQGDLDYDSNTGSDYDDRDGSTANTAGGAGANAKAPHDGRHPPLPGDEPPPPTSTPVLALVTGLVFFLLAGGLWWKTNGRSQYDLPMRENSKVVSADDMVGGVSCSSMHDEEATWEDESPPPRASSEGPSTMGKAWKVSVELDGGLSYQLSIPMSAAGTTALKQAIVNECLSSIGADRTPGTWLAGQLDTMAVQYIGAKGEPKTVKESSDFATVRGSRVLRVTQRAARSHERPPMISATPPPLAGPTVDIVPAVTKPLEI